MISRLRRFISRQLSGPSGRAGRIVARLMNRGNRRMNERAITLLGAQPGDRVLELGFGGGRTLARLLDAGYRVTGVEQAEDMLAAARTAYAGAIGEGRLELLEGSAETIPVPNASISAAMTVNTVYFWPDLEAGLVELHRVLKPGGTVVVGIRDGSEMQRVSPEVFTIRSPGVLAAAAAEAGFEVETVSPADQAVHFIVGRASS